ncbi:cell division protein FtsQ/DivIB [Leuconostoc citreum]|uniref:cell division protein FtsQ/DivIB n=1 Tax=Leuconostoc citreum TaxID=33964 RepID=UPI00200AABD2|nr:cell division protein FtsQ/DivIB [Leuconostoc citreum]
MMTRRPRQLWLSLVIFAILIIGTLAIIRPWQSIKQVTVNAMELPDKKVQTYAQVMVGTPYWQVAGQTQFIAERLVKSSDKIDSAQVKQQGTHVTIKVVEKVTAGYVQKKGQWYLIDRNGHLTTIGQPKGDAPIYAGFRTQTALQEVATQFVTLELTLRQNISQITFSPVKDNAKRLVIVMDDGNTVYATQDTFGKKISIYPGIAAQMPDKGIVDLQFGAYSYKYGTNAQKDDNKKK